MKNSFTKYIVCHINGELWLEDHPDFWSTEITSTAIVHHMYDTEEAALRVVRDSKNLVVKQVHIQIEVEE